MRIGYFVEKFPYSNQFNDYAYGGSSLVAYYLASKIAEYSHEVEVFTTSINSKDSIEKNKNILIYRYGTNFRILTSNISIGLFKKPVEHDVDIVHTHFDIPPGPLAGLIYAKKKKVPLIVTYHGDWVENYGGLFRRVGVRLHNRCLVEKLLSNADVIISPSKNYIDESKFLEKHRNKIVVIPNGINLSDFNISYSKEECREKLGLPLDKSILLFFGYLSPYKGPNVLLKAMPKILKDVPDANLVFAGKGIMRDELIALSKRLGIETYVKFVGFVEDFLKPFYYKAADVFVLPSTMSTESFGIVNLEAMACSTPIVASRIGGIPDVITDRRNGLLIKPNDPIALADAIIYLLENRDVRRAFGKNGLENVKRYSWDKIALKTEKIYKEVLS